MSLPRGYPSDCRTTATENSIPVISLRWSENGALFAGAMDGTIRRWADGDGEEAILGVVAQHLIEDIRASHDSSTCLCVWSETMVLRWDTDTGQELSRVSLPHLCWLKACLSKEGDTLFAANMENVLSVIDLTTGDTLGTLQLDATGISSVAFDGAANIFVAAKLDGSLLVWDDLKSQPQLHFLEEGIAITSMCLASAASAVIAAGIKEHEDRVFLKLWCWDIPSQTIAWYTEEEIFQLYSFAEQFNERIRLEYTEETEQLAVVTGDPVAPLRLVKSTSGRIIFRSSGLPRAQAAAFNSTGTEMALAHDNGGISILSCDEGSASFGRRLRILDVKVNARGANISGAQGMEEPIVWMRQGKAVQGTRLEFFADCGAILDDQQRRLLPELQARRPPSW